jgi:hypothetical protein
MAKGQTVTKIVGSVLRKTKIGLPENRKRLKGLGMERARNLSFDEGYDAGFKAGIKYAKGETMTPVPEGIITTSQSWEEQEQLVKVQCFHCAREFSVLRAELRTNNYCTGCK